MPQDRLKTAFIVNPISGIPLIVPRQTMVGKLAGMSHSDFNVYVTEYAGHAFELSLQCASEGYGLVVAVGGDGTVNEVARGLIHTDTVMGIIPCGSGNGLARHLGIPLDFLGAFRKLEKSKVIDIDYGLMNDSPFFTTCGVGFDALVSARFSNEKIRGRLKYVEKALHELRTYKNDSYTLAIDGEEICMEAFLVTCANANQWGNGAYIAPSASLCDGFLDICAIRNFSALDVPSMAIQLMNRQLAQNPLYFGRKCRELLIKRAGECMAHVDGDPVKLDGDIRIRVVHAGLKMAVPDRNRNM